MIPDATSTKYCNDPTITFLLLHISPLNSHRTKKVIIAKLCLKVPWAYRLCEKLKQIQAQHHVMWQIMIVYKFVPLLSSCGYWLVSIYQA